MTNKHVGGTNSHYNQPCERPHPNEKNWVCSLSRGHRGDHKAYWGHETASRTRFYCSWEQAGSPSRKATRDDVAEALASITATMTKRLPPATVAARIAETNEALAKKYDGDVRVQIHVQNNMKDELDRIIADMTALRDSLP